MRCRHNLKFTGIAKPFLLAFIFPFGIQAQTLPPMEVGISHSIITMTGPTPKDTKDARAHADNLVATQHAAGEFENITNDRQVKIRHIKSGVICRAPGLLMVSPPTEIEALSSARKFTCVNFANGFQNDLSITANSYSLSTNRALSAIVAEARAETNALNSVTARVSWDENLALEASNSLPSIARLSNGSKPNSRYLYISLTTIKGWIISDTVRGTLDQRARVDFVGDEMMRRAIHDAQANR